MISPREARACRGRPKTAGAVVGVLAREQGALVPGRQVSSAKSWLCLSSVDRTADILPWGAQPDERSCSPVAASARYLAHLRDAWNHSMARARAARRRTTFVSSGRRLC